MSFAAYNYYGVRGHGVAYLKQFMGPLLLLAPLMIVVEVFSHLFRPASLAIRLFGNMFADHLLLGIFTDLTKLVDPGGLLRPRDLRLAGTGAGLHAADDGLRRRWPSVTTIEIFESPELASAARGEEEKRGWEAVPTRALT